MRLDQWFAGIPFGEDYAIIIVSDTQLVTFTCNNFSKRFYWTEPGKYALSGIHVRNLRIHANMDKQPEYIKDALLSLAVGYGHEILPLD